ncbi:MAG: hypothetical protein WB988_27440 [Candidatus Nitrosopolaris sp.]|jgi:hypothetical protein
MIQTARSEIMIAATEDDMDEHVPSSVLSGKEKLVVTDLINQLDIASQI